MKVDAIKSVNYGIKTHDKNVGKKTNPVIQNYSPAAQLPNYESVSSKFPLNIPSFGGNFVRKSIEEINQEYLDQIKEAEKEIDVLKKGEESAAVKKAREENSFRDDFRKNWYSKYYEVAIKWADAAESRWRNQHNWLYRVSHQGELERLRGKELEYYYSRSRRADEIEPRYEANKELIRIAEANKANSAQRIKELEQLIDKLKKLVDYGSLRDSIEKALNGDGGLNDRIAGYSFVKNKIRKFIESLSASKDNEETTVSPCVILYGDTGTGKTTFLHSIESMASDDVEIVRFVPKETEPFMKQFRAACKESQARYKDTRKRTILLMDDAEKYFCMSTAEAKSFYGEELDDSDMEKLEEINKRGTNADVKEFKSILDVLAEIPENDEEGDSYKSAMSIFITTNHPHLIDRQLIKRPEKMDAYHVGPAKDEDLNEVVKFYFKDKERIISQLKLFKDRPDMEAAIDSIPNLDIDARSSIKKYFSANRADELHIDPSGVNYDALTEDIQPSEEDGAYSNVMIKQISLHAFEKYLQNPDEPYVVYFNEELENTARDIEPQRYKRYLDTSNFVNLYKQSPQIRNIEDMQEFATLLNRRNKGLISKIENTSLQAFVQNMQLRLEALYEKEAAGTLSENECVELELLKTQDELNKDPKKVKEYIKTHKKQG
ncbi:MAG: DnaA/Hda family protein [Muribaculaceae bacterium]|nr:DnaA/Hda family protein [Muribaculaceae bacterium]